MPAGRFLSAFAGAVALAAAWGSLPMAFAGPVGARWLGPALLSQAPLPPPPPPPLPEPTPSAGRHETPPTAPVPPAAPVTKPVPAASSASVPAATTPMTTAPRIVAAPPAAASAAPQAPVSTAPAPRIIVVDPTAAAPAPASPGLDPAAGTNSAALDSGAVRRTYSAWDYLCVGFDDSSASDTLNRAGENGWELVGVTRIDKDEVMCFQRPQAGARPVRF